LGVQLFVVHGLLQTFPIAQVVQNDLEDVGDNRTPTGRAQNGFGPFGTDQDGRSHATQHAFSWRNGIHFVSDQPKLVGHTGLRREVIHFIVHKEPIHPLTAPKEAI